VGLQVLIDDVAVLYNIELRKVEKTISAFPGFPSSSHKKSYASRCSKIIEIWKADTTSLPNL